MYFLPTNYLFIYITTIKNISKTNTIYIYIKVFDFQINNIICTAAVVGILYYTIIYVPIHVRVCTRYEISEFIQ